MRRIQPAFPCGAWERVIGNKGKNFHDVTVIVDPADYAQVLREIKETGNTTLKTRFRLAAKVFALTAKYDTTISAWLEKVVVDTNPYFISEK
jgi:phosphoribosylaminoimidazolecarboxamide formyltransferase/IMP cyclohydrolase